MSFNPLPPYVLHKTTAISQDTALNFLSAFLDRTSTEPAYRPDSHLTESGPVSSSTNARSDLTLHHLERIKQGLEGKRLRPEPVATAEEVEPPIKKQRRVYDHGEHNVPLPLPLDITVTPTNPGQKARGQETGTSTPKDWQDKSAYEEAQSDEDVDLNNAQHDPAGAGQEQPKNNLEAEEMLEVDVEGEDHDRGTGTSRRTEQRDVEGNRQQTVDKEERKRLKKEKRKREKTERAATKNVEASS